MVAISTNFKNRILNLSKKNLESLKKSRDKLNSLEKNLEKFPNTKDFTDKLENDIKNSVITIKEGINKCNNMIKQLSSSNENEIVIDKDVKDYLEQNLGKLHMKDVIDKIIDKKLSNKVQQMNEAKSEVDEKNLEFVEYRKKVRGERRERLKKELLDAGFQESAITNFLDEVAPIEGLINKKYTSEKSNSLALVDRKEGFEEECKKIEDTKDDMIKEIKSDIKIAGLLEKIEELDNQKFEELREIYFQEGANENLVSQVEKELEELQKNTEKTKNNENGKKEDKTEEQIDKKEDKINFPKKNNTKKKLHPNLNAKFNNMPTAVRMVKGNKIMPNFPGGKVARPVFKKIIKKDLDSKLKDKVNNMATIVRIESDNKIKPKSLEEKAIRLAFEEIIKNNERNFRKEFKNSACFRWSGIPTKLKPVLKPGNPEPGEEDEYVEDFKEKFKKKLLLEIKEYQKINVSSFSNQKLKSFSEELVNFFVDKKLIKPKYKKIFEKITWKFSDEIFKKYKTIEKFETKYYKKHLNKFKKPFEISQKGYRIYRKRLLDIIIG